MNTEIEAVSDAIELVEERTNARSVMRYWIKGKNDKSYATHDDALRAARAIQSTERAQKYPTGIVNIVAIYRNRRIGERTFCALFPVSQFEVSGVDHDTDKLRGMVVRMLRSKLIEQGESFHRAGRVPMPSHRSDFYDHVDLMAAYVDTRSAALFERWADPIPLSD